MNRGNSPQFCGDSQWYFSRMIIFLSLLVALVGVLVYALSANAKVAEIGRLAYAVGLLAFLLVFRSDALRLL